MGGLAKNEKKSRQITPWAYNPEKFEGETESVYRVRIVIEFFENHLKHSRDQFAGQPFILDRWESDLIAELYGTLDDSGYRQYREAYISMAKLNGKTQFVAGLLLFHLFHDGVGSQFFCAAGDRDQAGLVFSAAVGMILQNPDMSNAVKISESQKFIFDPTKRSFIRVLSHEAKTKHGIHPNVCVMDELHSWPNRHLYDVLHKGMTGLESLNLIITTSGNDRKSFGYDLYSYFKKIKTGEAHSPRLLSVIYESDPDDDIFSIETWKKANPSLGVHRSLEKIQEAADRAKNFPDEEKVFRWMVLNQWVERHISEFISLRKWDRCPIEDPSDLENRRCWMGIDLSIRDDITAICLCFEPGEDGIFIVRPIMFTPESSVPRRTRQGIPYQKWVDGGKLLTTEGDMIDQQTIIKYIVNLSTIFKVEEFIFDRYMASYIQGDLQSRGIWVKRIIEFTQGYGFNEVLKNFLQLLTDRKINHGGHPVLRWMASNLVVDVNWNGYLRPNKGSSKDKIDGITAMLMALDRAVRCQK